MKKMLILMLLALSQVACATNTKSQVNHEKDVLYMNYFHSTQRCPTCRAIESETKAVLDAIYPQDLQSGRIVWQVVNIDDESSENLVEHYEVAWSSLILEYNGKVINLTDDGFSYARNDAPRFRQILQSTIQSLLP